MEEQQCGERAPSGGHIDYVKLLEPDEWRKKNYDEPQYESFSDIGRGSKSTP